MPFDPIRSAIRQHPGLGQAEPPPAPKQAAVALVMRPASHGGLPDLLMIKRAEAKGDPWSGHMAFPGGRREAVDSDLLHTARRETLEELGLNLDQADPLGPLNPIVTPKLLPRPTMVVRPYAFGLQHVPPLQPNREVASTHWFNLARLLDGEGRATFPYTWKSAPIQLPCVRLDGCFIWGLSLRVIDDLLHRVRQQDP